MDEGLIQFLVVAFFIIISMMDGAARKRRKAAQHPGSSPESNRLFLEVDEDLGEVAESSESGLPSDVWEEIAELARGEGPASPRQQPATRDASSMDYPDSQLEAWTAPQEETGEMRALAPEGGERAGSFTGSYDRPDALSPTSTRSADLQGGYLHPDQAASHEEHAHEKHAEVAFPPSPPSHALPAERPHEFVLHSDELPKQPEKELRPARRPRSLLAGFRSGATASLREAIVLAEVLSPPVTLRNSGWKPPF